MEEKTWDQRRRVQQFKAGKISRVRYNYQEVKAGFATYLGAHQEPDGPWDQPISQKDYMEHPAFGEALCLGHHGV
jgi:hypothetical protein